MWTYKTEKSNFISLNDFNFAKLFTEIEFSETDHYLSTKFLWGIQNRAVDQPTNQQKPVSEVT